jgi:hypothetical protein
MYHKDESRYEGRFEGAITPSCPLPEVFYDVGKAVAQYCQGTLDYIELRTWRITLEQIQKSQHVYTVTAPFWEKACVRAKIQHKRKPTVAPVETQLNIIEYTKGES